MDLDLDYHYTEVLTMVYIMMCPCRALENILESGDPGVHHFANSVYKVGRDEGGAEHGSEDPDSDAYSEDGEAAASPDTSYTQHSFTQHSFADTQPSRCHTTAICWHMNM